MKIKPCLDANRRDLQHFIQALPEQQAHSIADIKELGIISYLMQRSAQGAAAKSQTRYRSHLKSFFAYVFTAAS